VRLLRGDFDERSDYGDPLRLAQEFLDGGRTGCTWSTSMERNPARRTTDRSCSPWRPSCGRRDGRGIRTTTDVEELLDAGVHRVVLGTAALEDPAWRARWAALREQVAIGLDYRRGTDGRPVPATKAGWTPRPSRSRRGSTRSATRPSGGVVTAIDRDGTLGAPTSRDSPSCSTLAVAVIASGGVGSAGISPHWRRWWARPAPAGRGHRRQGPRRWPGQHGRAVAACALSA